ncbi:MAG: hypothetical protein O2931_05400 [Planctomycetota bacterium]|nr:hypothetical protein [Planctomycetota bacterium]MDA1178217.1 hypothetical protein [Planctomycetota bacterium]
MQFVRRIQPLLSEKCLACHGHDESDIQGRLDMRSLAAMLKGDDPRSKETVLIQSDSLCFEERWAA